MSCCYSNLITPTRPEFDALESSEERALIEMGFIRGPAEAAAVNQVLECGCFNVRGGFPDVTGLLNLLSAAFAIRRPARLAI